MALETVTFEKAPMIFSKERIYEFEVPIVNIDYYGTCIVRYTHLEFKTLDFIER